MNPFTLMQFKPLLERFRERHPKFVQFFGYAGKSITEGSLVEITVTDPEGKKIVTNIRVDNEDIALFNQFKEML
ncbi:MAG: hypothetical protein E7504_07060 [Ruminococcus sp.]|nr:hypothetical protein [Ruminococcus sp.]